MFNGPFALALTAGMAATVNPCGFALLPAYLSAFVGLDEGASKTSAVSRALKVSAVMTARFIAVFGLFGAVITKLIGGVQEHLPWATIVIGLGLIGLGIYLLMGRQLVLNIPKLQKGGSDGTLLSMFLFGVSYAIASLSCTIGPFLAVTTTTFRNESYLSGVMIFVMYGLGMGVIVGVLTVAVAFAKDGVVNKFRSLLPKMNKIAGVLLLIAGAYVAYYGWYEVRVFKLGSDGDDPIIDAAIKVQNKLQSWIPTTDTAPQFAIGGAVLLAAALGYSFWRRRAGGDVEQAPGTDGESSPAASDST